ncbi:MAG: hypothetical protein IKR90_02125 [Clostridia bacterium]|nr:hypothetical protein [Clostridia bacterium]
MKCENAGAKKKVVILITIVSVIILAAAIFGIVYYAEYNSESARLERSIDNQQKVIDGLNRDLFNRQREIDDLEEAWSRYEYYHDRIK